MNTPLDELKRSLDKFSEKSDSKQSLANCFEPPERENSCKILSDIDLDDKNLDRELKERFARHVLWITYGWLGVLALLLIASGIVNIYQKNIFLSDTVLITLVSGTS